MTIKQFLKYVFKDASFTILVFNDLHGTAIEKIEATREDVESISIFDHLHIFKVLSCEVNHFIISAYTSDLYEYINGDI